LGALAGERIGRNPERGAGTKGISKKKESPLGLIKVS
jgi:hypothetical protein